MTSEKLNKFLVYMANNKKLFWTTIDKNIQKNGDLFNKLGIPMIEWAATYLGEGYEKVLGDGYSFFVTDVNKSQLIYEKRGHYSNKSYQEVYTSTYNNQEYMSKYHWGVYVTTFAWEHHLNIYKFFIDNFLKCISSTISGELIELGSGSGVWGLLVISQLQSWRVTGVDISKTSIDIAKKMANINGFSEKVSYILQDALAFDDNKQFDAAISCFLLEHLEQPEQLLLNMSKNLKIGGYAFLTVALTAAEVDHIYEFRKESEIVFMAEKAGFRVISYLSSAPEFYPQEYRFLPRSMALLMQKTKNDIW